MATQFIFGAFAFIPGTLALSTVLSLATPAAHAFEVERSNHGASRIVRTEKTPDVSDAPTLSVQPDPQGAERRSTIIVRGQHGAQKIVTQEGVGGTTGDYKGFPKLEQRGSHGGYRIVND